RGVGAAAATVTAVTAVTAGQTFPPLRDLTLLAPRHPDHGPQGLPVNRTAAQAGLSEAELSPSVWRLTVTGPRGFTVSLAELRAMPQHTARLPIACAEGWSADAEWTGVRLAELLRRAGGGGGLAGAGGVASAAGLVRGDGDAGPVRVGSADAAGAAAERRGAVAGPRLSGAGDRAEPPGGVP